MGVEKYIGPGKQQDIVSADACFPMYVWSGQRLRATAILLQADQLCVWFLLHSNLSSPAVCICTKYVSTSVHFRLAGPFHYCSMSNSVKSAVLLFTSNSCPFLFLSEVKCRTDKMVFRFYLNQSTLFSHLAWRQGGRGQLVYKCTCLWYYVEATCPWEKTMGHSIMPYLLLIFLKRKYLTPVVGLCAVNLL